MNFTFKSPVIVLGAPRSGTSLLHKILREHASAYSVAKESGWIWQPYTHPRYNNWDFEGTTNSLTLSRRQRQRIHRQFRRYAFSGAFWRRAAAANVHRYQRRSLLAPVLRTGYKAAAWLLPRQRAGDHATLTDKSVHSAFFTSLLKQAFPDARYIYLKRRADGSIPSMIRSWLNPNRFFTFSLPQPLAIRGYPFDRWNFALPPGWRDHLMEPLVDVVAWQWCEVQERLLHFARRSRNTDHVLELSLDELTRETATTIPELFDFAGLEMDAYVEQLRTGLPVVNASPESDPAASGWPEQASASIRARVAQLEDRMFDLPNRDN